MSSDGPEQDLTHKVSLGRDMDCGSVFFSSIGVCSALPFSGFFLKVISLIPQLFFVSVCMCDENILNFLKFLF